MTTESPAAARFAHLHLHTEYSLLDGGNKVSRLVERVKALGMDSVAVTDHGNMHAAVEFYTKAKAAGIKPILGIEAYVALGDRTEKKPTGIADGGFHLVLLAENATGWRNLLKLSSDAFLNGFYYKPRMDKSTLAQHADGIIAINGHLGSSLAHHLVQYVQTGTASHYEAAKEEAIWHRDTFGANEQGEPRFYVELQRHSVQEQERINPELIRLARDLDLPLVCDNDAHFLRAEDWDAHDSLCCISMQKIKSDPSRLHYSRDLYVKSPEEMAERFGDLPTAMENTIRIAERCDVEIDFSANHAPVVKIVSDFDLPADAEEARALARSFECEHELGSTEWFKAFCAKFELEPFDAESDHESTEELKRDCDAALLALAEAGAIWRYGPEYGQDGADVQKRARLDRELGILADKLISAYFLIVWDFVNWARQNGIPANARGSGVGTMVGYVLGLSNACPVEYGLLFERFTDPDRTEYPDIDVDICQDGRGAVIDYVRQKYGYVAQIITFGRLKAKAAIKDVARVNGLEPAEGQRLANLVPAELNITLDDALQKDPDFKAEYQSNPQAKAVVDTARALEDHARHAGIHAAGVVIATQPLDNIVPLCKATGSDDVVTQWDGPTCEKVGLLKMDFLGLRTLTTIELAKKLIRDTLDDEAIARAVGAESAEVALDLERLAYDDQRVLELFRRGDTSGIFQFESGGMRKLLLDMKPDRLEDLIAANALFRPGPMDLIPDYCARKHKLQPVPSVHEIVDGYTSETYGIMVYQEQVMQIVHGLGDIPLREAYTLIKAISKKKEAVINAMRPRFVDGATAKGLDEKGAGDLFDLILKFAGYGFNKSHSTGYAIIAYQTAYLKTYFPAQYMAAVLTLESGAKKVEDWAPYLEDCRQTIFPPPREAGAAGAAEKDVPEKKGIEVRPPDLNTSAAGFTAVFEPGEPRDNRHGHIRFGLGAIKGVGKTAIEAILKERDTKGPFQGIFEFCERVPLRVVNKATLESMIKAGAFDQLHGLDSRAALTAALDDAMSAGQKAAADRASGQMSIFGGGDDAADGDGDDHGLAERPLPSVPGWDRWTQLAGEKEVLGFHVSGHPLDEHAPFMRRFSTTDTIAIGDLRHDAGVVIGGLLVRVRITQVRNGRSAGERMAMITLQDRRGQVDGVVFSTTFARDAVHLQDQAIVLLVGRVDTSRGSTQVIVERVIPLEEAPRHLAQRLDLVFDAGADEADRSDAIGRMRIAAGMLKQSAAVRAPDAGTPVEVAIRLRTNGRLVSMRHGGSKVVLEPMLLSRLRDALGGDAVDIVGGAIPLRPNDRRKQWKKATVEA